MPRRQVLESPREPGRVDATHPRVDVSDPETAEIINTVNLALQPNAVAVEGGYAYVPSYWTTLYVVDIDPVESAFELAVVDSIGYMGDISVQDNYAYCAGGTTGLRIFELW